jgi:type IV pilus assembly protein PilM
MNFFSFSHCLLEVSLSLFDSLFRRQAPILLGIDLGSSSIKLVELGLGSSLENIVLKNYAIEPLKRGVIVDGVIEKFDELAESINYLIKRLGVRSRSVAMAIPTSAVITKRITLWADLNEKEMEEQIQAQASQYIPFPLEDVRLDFCIIGPSTYSAKDVDVLIAASRKEKVQDLQGLSEALGLHLQVIDIRSHAMRLAAIRSIKKLHIDIESSTVALFEMRSSNMKFQVLHGNDILYERDHAFGGSQLTQNISRHYSYTLDESELRKINKNLPDGYENEVFKPFIDNLVLELTFSLQMFVAEYPYQKISHIYLAGGVSSILDLSKKIHIALGITCSCINPFEGMKIDINASSNTLVQDASSYVTACGLALRGIFK